MPPQPERSTPHPGPGRGHRHGRLSPPPPPAGRAAGRPPGLLDLAALGTDVPGTLYAPPGADRAVLLLHGAGGSARGALELLLPVAREQRLLLVAPESTAATWDLIVGGFGPDVRRADAALHAVRTHFPVADLMVGGFSDGASYALSLGLTNGDVFSAVLAFSPGFAAPLTVHGRPPVYVAHGTGDRVLPIAACSRRLVPRLRSLGYDVTYDEFDGGHEVPTAVVRRAVAWLPRRPASPGDDPTTSR
jgi:poly(3-hydroxybutyrate) depolymerase